MNSDSFRVAFVGIDHPHGSGWRESLGELGEAAALVAVVPGFSNSLASLEERHSALPRFDRVEDLVAWGGFDGAVVCLPNDKAPAAAIELARSGKAILMEKPAAGAARDWEAAVKEVRKRRVAFQAGYMWRYDEGASRLRAMFQDRRFGKRISIQMRWFTSDARRRGTGHYLFDRKTSGGGFFNWLGCHWLDLLPWVTGSRAKTVLARVGNLADATLEVEDGGTAIIEMEDGAQAVLSGGYWLPRWAGESGWSVYGGDRWVHWNPAYPGTSGKFEIHGPQPQFMPMDEEFSLPPDGVKGYGGAKTVDLITDWIRCAREGGDCRNTPESVLETLRLVDAVYASSESGSLAVLA